MAMQDDDDVHLPLAEKLVQHPLRWSTPTTDLQNDSSKLELRFLKPISYTEFNWAYLVFLLSKIVPQPRTRISFILVKRFLIPRTCIPFFSQKYFLYFSTENWKGTFNLELVIVLTHLLILPQPVLVVLSILLSSLSASLLLSCHLPIQEIIFAIVMVFFLDNNPTERFLHLPLFLILLLLLLLIFW